TKGADGRGIVDLDLGLDGKAPEFVKKLIVDPKLSGLSQAEGQLPDRRLGRVMGLGQQLLHPRLELFLEIAFLNGRPGEKSDPSFVERRRCAGGRFGRGCQVLALEVRILAGIQT